MRFVALVTVSLIGLAVYCALSGVTTESRVKKHFGLSDVGSIEAMRAGLYERLPIGSSESEVIGFLKRSGIGEDPLSYMALADDNGVIFAGVRHSRSDFGPLVRFDYGFNFKLDERGALTEIVIVRVGTGP